jgi:hypothetical protein
MRHLLFTAALVGLVGSLSFLSARATGEEGNFVVLPVTTDLQRSAMGMDKASTACVVINDAALRRDDNLIRGTTLDFDALHKALLPLRKKSKEATVTFHLVCESFDKTDEEFRKLLRWVLIGFGQEFCFFRHARCTMSGPLKLPWQKHWEALRAKMAGKTDADEAATGNDLVMVYPVRTLLSRHLFDNSDCVITIIPPFAEDSDFSLSREATEAIHRYVGELDLKPTEKGRLFFRIRHKAAPDNIKAASDNAHERFYKNTAKEIASSLGFETYNVQYTPSR